MDVYEQIAVRIIKGQEAIIGPLAIEQAKMVPGVTVDWPKQEVSIAGDKVVIIESLIQAYKELFGQIAVEACKDAVSSLLAQLPDQNRPKSLQ